MLAFVILNVCLCGCMACSCMDARSVPVRMHAQNTMVNLTSCLLAGIYAGTITTWDNPQIRQINPGLKVPTGQPIKVRDPLLPSQLPNRFLSLV